MRGIVAIFIFAAVVFGAASFAWNYINPPAAFKKNVKMTVTVETPDGHVSGYAVREVSNKAPRAKMNWPHGGNAAEERGEAVVIDLGLRGKVFGLLPAAGYFFKGFPPPNRSSQSDEAMDYYAALPTGSVAAIDPDDYKGKFVVFTDIDDPKSVTLVRGWDYDKRELIDNFAKFFGEGVGLKSITLEITDEPVTWKIEQSLLWLPTVKSGSLDGSAMVKSQLLANILHYGHFKTGEP